MTSFSRTGRKRVVISEGDFYTAAHFYKDGKSQIFVNSPAGEKVQFRLSMNSAEARKIAEHLISAADRAEKDFP